MKKGDKVKPKNQPTIVRGPDKNGYVHVRFEGTEADKAISINVEYLEVVKRPWWKVWGK
jgi:DNA-binding protein YbaB